MANNYEQYQTEITSDIATALKAAECQPILFVGSGFSKRYASGPSWEELLEHLAAKCPLIKHEFAYYRQKYPSLSHIGSVFADSYREWAWTSGRKLFPEIYYSANYSSDIFIKHIAAKILGGLKLAKGNAALTAELAALSNMEPHAVITTNYDVLLEPLFPKYEVIVGQQIFRKSFLTLGEIFKIHGTVTDPLSMVLVEKDYQEFDMTS